LKLFTLYHKRKRAISPVIAVILLIGLAVAAAAAIFLVVMPLFEPTSNLDLTDAYVEYDGSYTKTVDIGVGYGSGSVFLSNLGTGKILVTEINISYRPVLLGDWEVITNAISLQDITTDNPYEINPLAIKEELTMRFIIPNDNEENTIAYRMTITTKDGTTLDTSRVTAIDEEDMLLAEDRPSLTPPAPLDVIRRTSTISPLSVSDNSEIKNVTYDVSTSTDFSNPNRSVTITSPLWRWQWDTINSTTDEGLDNGSYYLRITVHDYAGLYESIVTDEFTIDNDYEKPTIGELWLTDPYSGIQTAEVGESISMSVELIDTGTIGASASEVDSATLYYRINDSVEVYSTLGMQKSGTTNNWTTTIPSIAVDSTALEEGIECYVEASDIDGNSASTSESLKKIPVEDNFKPDISHTPITEASVMNPYITLTATITDEDQVNTTTAKLYYRQTDDYGGATEAWNSISPLISGDEYSWLIWSTDISIHGLDYYFNVTDRFSGHVAYEGQEASPHHIDIPDEQAPVITHAEIPTATNTTSLDIDCTIYDNDPTFGADPGRTGSVTLSYRDYDSGGAFQLISMSCISGNSSIDVNGETPSSTIWSGTIPGSAIDADGDPRLDYYITAEDDSSNSEQNGDPFHTVTVIPQGKPNVLYVSDSMTVRGSIGEEIEFTVENVAGSGTAAKIAGLNLTILSSTADFSTDYPMLNMTEFDTTEVWSNVDGVANSTWITFTTNFTINEGDTVNITMTFENDSNQPYSLNGLNLKLVLETYNIPQDELTINSLDFNVQPGSVSMIKQLYMTYPTYSLSETGTTSAHIHASASQNERNPPIIQLGIRVFIGAFEITSSVEAKVTLTSTWTEQQGYWWCPQTALNPSNGITIEVVALIDGNEYSITEFTTGPLDATELSSSQWEINYWGRYTEEYQNRWFDAYSAEFGFGDTYTYDSFVNYFTYVTSG